MTQKTFHKRYVLGEGYPWAYGVGPYTEVGLNTSQRGVSPVKLKWPKTLWAANLPRYRLVLELVEEKP